MRVIGDLDLLSVGDELVLLAGRVRVAEPAEGAGHGVVIQHLARAEVLVHEQLVGDLEGVGGAGELLAELVPQGELARRLQPLQVRECPGPGLAGEKGDLADVVAGRHPAQALEDRARLFQVRILDGSREEQLVHLYRHQVSAVVGHVGRVVRRLTSGPE